MSRLIIGHTTESSTVIWVRGAQDFNVAFVKLEGGGINRTQTVELEERHFFTGTAEFRQLKPNQKYEVSVAFGESKSTPEHHRVTYGHCDGRVRTFQPDNSSKPFSFILGSCNLHSLGIFSNPDKAFEQIADMAIKRDASFMIHCGDQIYYDIPIPFKNPDLDEYRDKYLDAWGDSRRTRKFLTTLPQYMILDDHEITNNFANDMDASLASATPQMFRDIATKVYREFQHIRHPQHHGNQALYYNFNVGKTQFFVLDTRSERYLGTGSHSAQMIGDQQMKTFLSWLKKHKNAVKFVITAVPFVFEVKNSDDKWNGPGFLPQREVILEHIVDNKITGVVFLTGDMHCSGHAELTAQKNQQSVVVHELMSSPINQVGKSSFSDFFPKVTRTFGNLKYTSSISKSEFFDEHSNATAIQVDQRKISYEIFRTKKNKIAKRKKTFVV